MEDLADRLKGLWGFFTGGSAARTHGGGIHNSTISITTHVEGGAPAESFEESLSRAQAEAMDRINEWAGDPTK